MDWKRSYLISLTGTENTNWETAAMHISVAKEAIRKATGMLNTPVECWGCTNPPNIMRTCFTPTETAPTRGIRTLLNDQSSQFKSIINKLPWWGKAEVTRIAKGNVVRRLQYQCAPCFQSGGFSSPNHGKRKDLDLYTRHYLCVKWWTHIHPGQCGWYVQYIWR